ncbi:hydrogen gas-evolving membrane-bound hydrogenase subunit E [Rhodococcus sp. NPDC056960]|uniref:hydrogen gas-evolving membrane-bound hydrogenase subunit E n=1 Tax=Rhodococcus TaxID=1827 RepID=UPI00362F0A82
MAVLVETMITLVFIAAFSRLPSAGPTRGHDDGPARTAVLPRTGPPHRRWRNVVAGGVAGLAAFAGIWGFLSAPTSAPGVAEEYIRLTPSAHGQDVVTVIITDFRGLDTLAEITVLLIAVVGVATLLRGGKRW